MVAPGVVSDDRAVSASVLTPPAPDRPPRCRSTRDGPPPRAVAPMPTSCSRCSCLPSDWSAGATITSALWKAGDVLVAAGGHRGAQAAHQVEGAVVLVRRAEQDLLERAVLGRLHARAARKRRMEGRHPPVVAVPGRLVGAGERRADHHGVGAAGERLRDVAAVAHAAVGDHLHVLARLEHVLRARRRDVRDRRGLRDADAEHAARGAGGARPDADEHADRAGAHQVQPGRVGGAAADHHRHRHLADELLQVERLGARRHVLGRDHRALDDEDVEAGLDRGLVVVAHALRRERGGRDHALVLDLADPLRDAGPRASARRRCAASPPVATSLGCCGDALELARGVVVARPDALEVEDGEPAEVAEDAGGLGRDDAVHGGSEQRQVEAVRTEGPGDVDVIGIARAPARHYRDVIEAICAAALLAASDLNFHGGILSSAADENLTIPMPNRA